MAMFRSVSEMKDSGIEWIGDIPHSWIVARLKNVKSSKKYSIVDGPFGSAISTDDYVDNGVPLIRITNLVNGRVSLSEMVYITEEHAAQLKRSETGLNDIIFAKTGGTVGKCAINNSVDYGILSSSCIKLSVSNKNDHRYYYYFCSTPNFTDALINACTGTTRNTINLKPFSDLACVIPPNEEQQAIADYLDERCSKIDEIIAEATESIEEYKRLKQAVIDSALDGYKDIHIKMRQLGTLKNGLNFHGSEDTPNIMFLGVSCVKDNMFLDKREQFEDLHIDFNVSDEYLLRDGDIVFVRSNGSKELVGRSVMVRNIDYPLTYSGFCIRFRNERIDLVMNEYLLYFFRTSFFKQSLLKYSNDSTNINNLNQEMLNAIRIDAPILEKQKEIADFLGGRIQEIDSLITEKQSLIEDLQAYKKSLIYEVVTGKRKVI